MSLVGLVLTRKKKISVLSFAFSYLIASSRIFLFGIGIKKHSFGPQTIICANLGNSVYFAGFHVFHLSDNQLEQIDFM